MSVAKKLLTHRAIEALRPPPFGKRLIVWDAGCPSFAVRVTDKGVKSFVLVCRFPGNPNPTTKVLGRVGVLSLEEARNKGRDWLKAIALGRDPSLAEAQAKSDTIQAVCEDYLKLKAARQRSVSQSRSRLERLVYPALGSMPIGSVRRSDVARLHDEIAVANGPIIANRTIELLGRVFNWFAARSDDFRSPMVRGMLTPEQSRDRVLTDDELRRVWAATEWNWSSDLHPAFCGFIRFLLLTGCRRNEAAGMKWAELGADGWLLPSARNKTQQDLLRPLSGAALAVIDAQRQLGDRWNMVARRAGSDWVFSRDGRAGIGGFSVLKAQLDQASGVSDWTLHDLRRTARSLMSRAGVASDHAERALGHVIGGVRGTYDRYEYRNEKLAAFERLATLVAEITST
jgi:integrase